MNKTKPTVIAIVVLGLASLAAVFIIIIGNRQNREIKNSEDFVVAKVDDREILFSEIEFVFDDVKRSYHFSNAQEENEYKHSILENGINEIVVISEGEKHGFRADIEESEDLLNDFKENMTSVYEMMIERYGEDKYAEDLKKRIVYNNMRTHIVSEMNTIISDDELFSSLEVEIGLSREVFDANYEYYFQQWHARESDKYFSSWVNRVRSNHDITYYYDFITQKTVHDKLSISEIAPSDTDFSIVSQMTTHSDIYDCIFHLVEDRPLPQIYFDPSSSYYDFWSLDDVSNHYGSDVFTLSIPDDLYTADRQLYDRFGFRYLPDNRLWTIVYDNNDKLIYDDVEFNFKDNWSDDFLPERRELDIILSKGEFPLLCNIFIETESGYSVINDIPMYLGYSASDMLIAKFNVGDNYYFIKGVNIHRDEFLVLLQSFIKTGIPS